MGARCSRRVDPTASHVDGRSGGSYGKVSEALRLKSHAIRSGHEPPLSFDKLLLKFPSIEAALDKINAVFDAADVNHDGRLSLDEFRQAMGRLSVVLGDEEVVELFHASDMEIDNELSKREFLVCLAMGFMIDAVPALNACPDEAAPATSEPPSTDGPAPASSDSPSTDEAAPPSTDAPDPTPSPSPSLTPTAGMRRTFSQLKDSAISDAMMLITRTYLMFDQDGKGWIDKNELQTVLEEHAKAGGGKHNPLASKDRWREMDWDQNSCITFQEFVFSFYTWINPEAADE